MQISKRTKYFNYLLSILKLCIVHINNENKLFFVNVKFD